MFCETEEGKGERECVTQSNRGKGVRRACGREYIES